MQTSKTSKTKKSSKTSRIKLLPYKWQVLFKDYKKGNISPEQLIDEMFEESLIELFLALHSKNDSMKKWAVEQIMERKLPKKEKIRTAKEQNVDKITTELKNMATMINKRIHTSALSLREQQVYDNKRKAEKELSSESS